MDNLVFWIICHYGAMREQLSWRLHHRKCACGEWCERDEYVCDMCTLGPILQREHLITLTRRDYGQNS